MVVMVVIDLLILGQSKRKGRQRADERQTLLFARIHLQYSTVQ